MFCSPVNTLLRRTLTKSDTFSRTACRSVMSSLALWPARRPPRVQSSTPPPPLRRLRPAILVHGERPAVAAAREGGGGGALSKQQIADLVEVVRQLLELVLRGTLGL